MFIRMRLSLYLGSFYMIKRGAIGYQVEYLPRVKNQEARIKVNGVDFIIFRNDLGALEIVGPEKGNEAEFVRMHYLHLFQRAAEIEEKSKVSEFKNKKECVK